MGHWEGADSWATSQLGAENAAQTPALPIVPVTSSQFCHLWALVSPIWG